ncbi:MAG: ROK family protein [Chitinophagaceae bacterium]|nr:ROK family protein [Chitinophagaceae bacterium]
MSNEAIIGIDIGGTYVRAARVESEVPGDIDSKALGAEVSIDEILETLFKIVDKVFGPGIDAIGIGVPGLVDQDEGVVYDVMNIPSWKSVRLKEIMEARYQVPVLINNDANCFALGEFYFGQGIGHDSLIGVTLGTGLGSGIILNSKLYTGKSGGAGEFGMIQYLDKYYEYYASGQFFQNVYGRNGENIFLEAQAGNQEALRMYAELGVHLGNALKTILLAYDVDLIILGGSVSRAYSFFSAAMWEQVKNFVFQNAVEKLEIKVTQLPNSGILGAAALHYNKR